MANSNRFQSSAARVAHAVNQVNQPAFCPSCGSVYFTEVSASMYSPSGNGFRSISTTPMKVYVCPCGELILPPGYNAAAPAGSERALFSDSMTAANNARKERSLDAISKGTVGISEFRRLQEAFNTLVDQFNNLASGSDVAQIEQVDVPNDNEETIGEQPPNDQQIDTSLPQSPADLTNDRFPIANGISGRSIASAIVPNGPDGSKTVETAARPAVAGGARARMSRQGR